jgi:hypothetical protein
MLMPVRRRSIVQFHLHNAFNSLKRESACSVFPMTSRNAAPGISATDAACIRPASVISFPFPSTVASCSRFEAEVNRNIAAQFAVRLTGKTLLGVICRAIAHLTLCRHAEKHLTFAAELLSTIESKGIAGKNKENDCGSWTDSR